jgi:proteic killer suppression protein
MISSIRHRGLKRLYERADPSRIDPRLREKVQRVLTALDVAAAPQDMDLPGYALHPLTGTLQGFWSVRVSGNWRVIFRIESGRALDVDLVDYH